MILLLHGADQLAVRRRLDALRTEADGGTGMLSSNLTEINGRTAKPGEILAAAMATPFLAPMRMVIVSNMLNRFGYVDPISGQSNPRFAPSIKPLEPLFEGLESGVPPTTVLIFTGETLTRGNPLRARLAKIPGVHDELHREPSRKELPGRIANEGKLRNLTLDARTAAALADAIGTDMLMLGNELDKLALYTMGRKPTADDVHEVCSTARATRSYEFSDALLDGDVRKAWESQRILVDAGVSVDEILGYLLPVVGSLARAAELLEQRESPETIGKAIKQTNPYPRDKVIARARRLGPDGVRRVYEAIVAIDRQRKQGDINDAVALELLIGRLTDGKVRSR